jgi:hypothetical protein
MSVTIPSSIGLRSRSRLERERMEAPIPLWISNMVVVLKCGQSAQRLSSIPITSCIMHHASIDGILWRLDWSTSAYGSRWKQIGQHSMVDVPMPTSYFVGLVAVPTHVCDASEPRETETRERERQRCNHMCLMLLVHTVMLAVVTNV